MNPWLTMALAHLANRQDLDDFESMIIAQAIIELKRYQIMMDEHAAKAAAEIIEIRKRQKDAG